MTLIVDTARPPRHPRVSALRRPEWHPDKRIIAAAVFVIGVALLTHMPNMLHYPYIEDDEGYYFSQGWAVFHQGSLGPKPYIFYYEHVPLGWIQIGLWNLLTGAASFGYAIASGRVLMLLLQIGSSLLVFSIARKESGRIWVGVLAAVIFAVSPYGIYYHRRVLLDNVTGFWILVSLRALVGTVTLRRVWVSGAALGIAMLSKEIAIVTFPAMAMLAARQIPKQSRPFAICGWPGIALALLSTYPLMALLKGEFFPAGTLLGGYHKHVSLICSLEWQSGRGPHDGGILNPSSQFWTQAANWAQREPLLVIGGSLAAVISIVLFRRNPVISMIGWMILSLWVFLGSGGILVDFYLVPVLPLLALSLALVAGRTVRALASLTPARRSRLVAAGLVTALFLGCMAAFIPAYHYSEGKVRIFGHSLVDETPVEGLWHLQPVNGQVEAVHYIQQHLPPNSRMIIDMSMWFDLHHPTTRQPAFVYAEYYMKAAADPSIAKGIFSDNWRKVRYVITTRQLLQDAQQNGFSLIINAVNHSKLLAHFDTGGWPVEVREVDPRLPDNHILQLNKGHYWVPACMTYGT